MKLFTTKWSRSIACFLRFSQNIAVIYAFYVTRSKYQVEVNEIWNFNCVSVFSYATRTLKFNFYCIFSATVYKLNESRAALLILLFKLLAHLFASVLLLLYDTNFNSIWKSMTLTLVFFLCPNKPNHVWPTVCLSVWRSFRLNKKIQLFSLLISCIWSNIVFQKLITGKMEKIDWNEINEFVC